MVLVTISYVSLLSFRLKAYDLMECGCVAH